MANQFWEAALPLIKITEKHPFLIHMVDGTLTNDKFQYYVLQDALYLTDFADCLRRLGEASPIPRNQEKLFALAKGAEEDEKELHRSFFKKWNIQEDGGNVEAMPNTVLYTSYALRVVTTCSHEEGLAVLLPCFWVYMHVGQCLLKLREELGDSVERPPAYDAWIDMYASPAFEKEVKDYIEIVDTVAKNASDKVRAKMQEHFIMCCKLEHMFWDQADSLMKWPELGM